jgi:hypothetical protein
MHRGHKCPIRLPLPDGKVRGGIQPKVLLIRPRVFHPRLYHLSLQLRKDLQCVLVWIPGAWGLDIEAFVDAQGPRDFR